MLLELFQGTLDALVYGSKMAAALVATVYVINVLTPRDR